MALTTMTAPALGQPAPDFCLTGTDGREYRLADVAGGKGTVLAVICNHCPYVKAIVDRMAADLNELCREGFGAAAIMPNDTKRYPDDSLDNMAVFARQHGFAFPYLINETQEVARALGAVCTPEFYGLDGQGIIRYAGRLDDAGRSGEAPTVRELVEAMRLIARTGEGPAEQFPSMGCSIKWR